MAAPSNAAVDLLIKRIMRDQFYDTKGRLGGSCCYVVNPFWFELLFMFLFDFPGGRGPGRMMFGFMLARDM